MCKDSMTKLKCENVDCSAKLHAIKCVRARPGVERHNATTGDGGNGSTRDERGRRDHGAPRGGGQWPRDRSVWDTQHGVDRQDGRGADRQDGRNFRRTGQNGDHQDAGFRERHQPPVGQPPTDGVGLLRQELLLQQRQFQQQMMDQIEQMLSRVHGGGMWLGRTHSKY